MNNILLFTYHYYHTRRGGRARSPSSPWSEYIVLCASLFNYIRSVCFECVVYYVVCFVFKFTLSFSNHYYHTIRDGRARSPSTPWSEFVCVWCIIVTAPNAAVFYSAAIVIIIKREAHAHVAHHPGPSPRVQGKCLSFFAVHCLETCPFISSYYY